MDAQPALELLHILSKRYHLWKFKMYIWVFTIMKFHDNLE